MFLVSEGGKYFAEIERHLPDIVRVEILRGPYLRVYSLKANPLRGGCFTYNFAMCTEYCQNQIIDLILPYLYD